MELFLEKVGNAAKTNPDRLAVVSADRTITYGDLWRKSDALASFLLQNEQVKDGCPIGVYGHKDPLMFVCFLACVKSGHPYVPIDTSVPDGRVSDILSQIDTTFFFAVEAFDYAGAYTVDRIDDAIARFDGQEPDASCAVIADDLYYILFTSGSTGTPKGVQISHQCITNFAAWSSTLGDVEKDGAVFLNQAPFSFDLSVYELAMSLSCGGTLLCLTKAMQDSMKLLFETFGTSNADIWVSTPSFATMCLSDPSFSAELLPKLKLFLFCGETLLPSTAAELAGRFPGAQVYNTYGPTESTVAVTSVVIDDAILAKKCALPVGIPKKGTKIEIVDSEGKTCAPGEQGEIIIIGDTVGLGYWGRPDLSEAAFGTTEDGVRYYRTGDLGSLDESGMLNYAGRMDSQIKLNGFRIELNDIQENIAKLPHVSDVAVVAAQKDGAYTHITAFVVMSERTEESDFREGLAIKNQLKPVIPHYMVPKKVVFLDELPRTNNGKADLKALKLQA